jgi:hypothetical protein
MALAEAKVGFSILNIGGQEKICEFCYWLMSTFSSIKNGHSFAS